MSETPTLPALDWRHLVTVAAAGVGGLLLRDIRRWWQRRKAQRERDRLLLDALRDYARYALDAARTQDTLRATGRIRPHTAEELAQLHGQDVQRRHDIARRLWEATGNVERRAPRQRQDVLTPDKLEADEQ